MATRFDWTGVVPVLVIALAAIALTAWQTRVDRSVFERFPGAAHPVMVMIGVSIVGVVALAHLQQRTEFAVAGPGAWKDALQVTVWSVPLLAVAAIAADVAFRYPEDTNVAMPDALRFYPAIAVFVEVALHVVPITALVALLGMPSGIDVTFWRIAIPVALIEAVLQAVYATSFSTAVFSAVQLMVFGVAQVWLFWRYGFVWMLGFRLAYYALWHLVWGVARLHLLF